MAYYVTDAEGNELEARFRSFEFVGRVNEPPDMVVARATGEINRLINDESGPVRDEFRLTAPYRRRQEESRDFYIWCVIISYWESLDSKAAND